MDRRTFIDQMGFSVEVPFPPRKIVSLVPSQTELLADLGLEDHVAGITKFCVHPPSWRKIKAIVGGTKKFDFAAIDQLCPDLIIGNKEENYKEGIDLLREKYPVWMSDISTLEDAYAMMHAVGTLTDREFQSQDMVRSVVGAFSDLKRWPGFSVLYLIWRNPWMAAGKETFIDTILSKLNLKNVVRSFRYPVLTTEAMREMKPDYIFLSSEPYPFEKKHLHEITKIFPASNVLLVDGEMFSWYGSRLRQAPDYFNQLQPA